MCIGQSKSAPVDERDGVSIETRRPCEVGPSQQPTRRLSERYWRNGNERASHATRQLNQRNYT
jgi:hypothetical protein